MLGYPSSYENHVPLGPFSENSVIILPQIYQAAHFLNWPLLCYAAEKSASGQH